MINKKVLLFLLIGLLTISAVNASDVANKTNDLEDTGLPIDNSVRETTLEIADVNQSSGHDGTFDDLKTEIEGLKDNGNLILTKNYTYDGSGDFPKIVIGQNNVTIDGNGHTLNANGGGRIFEITGNGVVLKNLIFTNSNANNSGGVIYNNQANALTIVDSSFINNSAYYGGAIYNNGGNSINIINSNFINNTAKDDRGASYGGAIYNYGGTNFTIKNSLFKDNFVINDKIEVIGGAIVNMGSGFTVVNSTFIDNSAEGDTNRGGAIWNRASNVVIKDSKFVNNSADYGGAIFNAGSNFTVLNSTFDNNTAIAAGAIFNYGALNFKIIKSNFTNNVAITEGGAIDNWDADNFIIKDSIFKHNSAVEEGYGHGGAIDSGGANITIDNSVFIDNFAYSEGGVIVSYDGNLNVVGSSFINNSAQDNGGVIYSNISIVVNSSFVGNSARNCGGAISSNNTIITNSNFTNNSAQVYGGAIDSYGGSDLIVEASSFVDNYARIHGGAITNHGGGDLIVNGSSFVGNSAQYYGGAIYNEDGLCIVSNSSFINNLATINGGAISNYADDFIIENNNTFDNNTAATGSDIYNYVANTKLISNDVSMLFKDGTRFTAILTDILGNPLANQTLTFTIHGKSYNKSTDENGLASIAINLISGVYDANVCFNGTSQYCAVSKNVTININSTILGSNLVKMYQNGTQFYAKFLNSNREVLANASVKFNINGMVYNRTTNSTGFAKLNINLNPGNYTLTAYDLVNGEERGFNVLVKSLILASDLTKYYHNASKFEAKVYDKNGSLAVNRSVTFNINGKIYTHMSDGNGVVSLNINLNPGDYVITTVFEGLEVSNNVKVLPTLVTKDLTMSYHDGSTFNATVLDGEGNPLANQIVLFNVNGVFYNRTAGNDGVASLNINLNPGEYIITSMWDNYQVGNKITIS